MFNFLVSKSAISGIVREVCKAIWKALHPTYLKVPTTQEAWKEIAKGFQDEWNMPHVLGAVDGKHVEIECPPGEGSNCFNYLKYHSTVLMAMCDAKYKFTYVDIGSYGHENDAGIFSSTDLYRKFDNGLADIPPQAAVEGHMLPHVLLGDDIFMLKPWLVKPYPGVGLEEKEKIANYRISRARRTIENAFGILRARWRIFAGPMKAKLDLVDLIVQACTCLHNYLLSTENARYTPEGFVDSYNSSGDLINGKWRKKVSGDGEPALRSMGQQGSNNYAMDAKTTRNAFRDYVNSPEGSVSWQKDKVSKS